tara:strand:+ start:508 stop:678 length:171 start_codon:yes stop_codon:yes gene_type:complete
MNTDSAVEKFNSYMTQHTDKVPLLSVKSVEDKRFSVLREFLSSSLMMWKTMLGLCR